MMIHKTQVAQLRSKKKNQQTQTKGSDTIFSPPPKKVLCIPLYSALLPGDSFVIYVLYNDTLMHT